MLSDYKRNKIENALVKATDPGYFEVVFKYPNKISRYEVRFNPSSYIKSSCTCPHFVHHTVTKGDLCSCILSVAKKVEGLTLKEVEDIYDKTRRE